MLNDVSQIQRSLKAVAFVGALACCTSSSTAGEIQAILPSPEYAPGQRVRDVLVDPFTTGPAPGVFVALWGSTSHSLVRLTPADAQSSAFYADAVDAGLSSAFQLTYNQNEGIYAGGRSNEQYTRRDSASVWTVRRSAHVDRGNPNTWRDDDRFYFQTITKSKSRVVYNSVCLDVNPGNSGEMFATGRAYNGSSDRWIIRRKLPGSTVWTTVRDEPTGNINMNPGLCAFPGNQSNPQPAVFAVGDEGYRWAILRSQDGGAANTWVKVDAWPEGPAQSAAVEAAVDGSGNIYVVGYRGVNGTNPHSWTLRRSSDGGNTWTTMLDVLDPTMAAAVSLGIDSTGAVTVSGTATPDGSTRLWKVVRCTTPDNPAAWTAAFAAGVFPFAGTYSQGSGVAADPFGNLFLGGTLRERDASGNFISVMAGLVRMVP